MGTVPHPYHGLGPRDRRLGSWAAAHPLALVVAGLLVVLVTVGQVAIVGLAVDRLGVDRGWLLAVLGASFLGGVVDVPVARLGPRRGVPVRRIVTHLGVRYVVTGPAPRPTVVSVNVGGALVPCALAAYLVVHLALGWTALPGVVVVALVVHLFARPVRRIGVVVPALVPPVTAAAVALLIGGPSVPALAYVSGVLGCLLGADLLNLGRVRDLGAASVSIGGAGTFDGIFLAGAFAVLIASL